MRKLLLTAAAAAAALGGAMLAQGAQAQRYYVPAPAYAAPGYHYDEFGRLVYDDAYRPGYAPPLAGAVIGPPLYDAYARVPVDRFGPDPNGMIAADGHRIKCKLTDDYNGRLDRYVTRRVCD